MKAATSSELVVSEIVLCLESWQEVYTESTESLADFSSSYIQWFKRRLKFMYYTRICLSKCSKNHTSMMCVQTRLHSVNLIVAGILVQKEGEWNSAYTKFFARNLFPWVGNFLSSVQISNKRKQFVYCGLIFPRRGRSLDNFIVFGY